MLNIVIDSILKRKLQSIISVLITALCVSISFMALIIYIGVSDGIDTAEKRMGADLLVIPSDAKDYVDSDELLFTGAPLCMYFDSSIADKIKNIDGVTALTSQFYCQTLNSSCCSTSTATRLIGFEPDTDWVLRSWADESNCDYGSDDILAGVGVEGIDSNEIYIIGNKFNVAKRLNQSGTMLDYSIVLNIDMARKIAKDTPDLQHFWEEYGSPDNLVSCVLVNCDKSVKSKVCREIKKLGDLEVIESLDILDKIHENMNIVFSVMLISAIIFTAVSMLQLFAKSYSLFWERKSEWGLFRAIGASKKDLKMLVITETLILSGIGCVAGIIFGTCIYNLFIHYMLKMSNFPYIKPSVMEMFFYSFVVLIVYLLIALFSAWIPAKKSSKIEPYSAMVLGDID